MASTALGMKASQPASVRSSCASQVPVGSQPASANTSAPSRRDRATQDGSTGSAAPSPMLVITARERGGTPISSSASIGSSWPWVTMLRSRCTAIETVTGECHCAKRRDRERSTRSWSARVCQQKSA
jgi:hypothetical protein